MNLDQMVDFEESLRQLGLKKADIARQLGVDACTVSRWKNHPPQYVWAYLEQVASNQAAHNHMNKIIHNIQSYIQQQVQVPYD